MVVKTCDSEKLYDERLVIFVFECVQRYIFM